MPTTPPKPKPSTSQTSSTTPPATSTSTTPQAQSNSQQSTTQQTNTPPQPHPQPAQQTHQTQAPEKSAQPTTQQEGSQHRPPTNPTGAPPNTAEWQETMSKKKGHFGPRDPENATAQIPIVIPENGDEAGTYGMKPKKMDRFQGEIETVKQATGGVGDFDGTGHTVAKVDSRTHSDWRDPKTSPTDKITTEPTDPRSTVKLGHIDPQTNKPVYTDKGHLWQQVDDEGIPTGLATQQSLKFPHAPANPEIYPDDGAEYDRPETWPGMPVGPGQNPNRAYPDRYKQQARPLDEPNERAPAVLRHPPANTAEKQQDEPKDEILDQSEKAITDPAGDNKNPGPAGTSREAVGIDGGDGNAEDQADDWYNLSYEDNGAAADEHHHHLSQYSHTHSRHDHHELSHDDFGEEKFLSHHNADHEHDYEYGHLHEHEHEREHEEGEQNEEEDEEEYYEDSAEEGGEGDAAAAADGHEDGDYAVDAEYYHHYPTDSAYKHHVNVEEYDLSKGDGFESHIDHDHHEWEHGVPQQVY